MENPVLTAMLVDEAATLAFGARLGTCVRAGDFIALHGGLGAGKTTLARGLIHAFIGYKTDVPSPTFTLVQTYTKTPDAGPSLDLFHFDLYRLKSSEEVWELGWEDIGLGVAVVEWPENAQDHLPADRLDIYVSAFEGGRKVEVFARDPSVWKDRLNGV